MLEIFLVIFLLFLNGFFVSAEFALVRVRASQLEIMADEGHGSARRVLNVLNDVDSYLSAVQLGITIASLGLGWIAEPAVNRHLLNFMRYLNLPIAEDFLQYISFIIAFSLVSFLHIVIGEIAPKSIAIAKPLEMSIGVALPMQIFHWVFKPVLLILTSTSNLILKLLGIEPVQAGHSIGVSAEELRNIAQHSSADGTISEVEGNLVDKVFNFSNLVAKEIMVQRGKVHAIKYDESLESALSYALEQGHTRYPLYRENLDEIIGIIHLRDMVAFHLAGGQGSGLEGLARDAVYVPETATVSYLLERLQKQRSHLAIVVDEYGGTSGVVTMEDALEELVGEIDDEFDPVSSQLIVACEGGYWVNGEILLSDLCEFLGIDSIEADSDTLSGYVMELLGRVAKVGDTLESSQLFLKVVSMERFRIVKVFVMVLDSHCEIEGHKE